MNQTKIERILEPEVMDTEADALDYDQMDFSAVNAAFAQQAIALSQTTYDNTKSFKRGTILDIGTGTARIPILMAKQCPDWHIVGIDLASTMLAIARQNVTQAGLNDRITLAQVDGKQLPYADQSFDGVVSNSLVHHLPNPLPFFQELQRIVKPEGFILIRDLQRPLSLVQLNTMVDAVGEDYNPHQKQLFWDSLHAALTLEEVQQLIDTAGLTGVRLYPSSDRHWTIERHYRSQSS
jgi:SAM-dependent methyltransferase